MVEFERNENIVSFLENDSFGIYQSLHQFTLHQMDDLFYKKIFVFSNVIPYCYIHLWNSLLVQYNEYLI